MMILMLFPADFAAYAEEVPEVTEIMQENHEPETERETTETDVQEQSGGEPAINPAGGTGENVSETTPEPGMELFSLTSLPLLGTGAPGDSTWQEGFQYTLDETEGTVTLTSYTGAGESAVTIASEAVIDGHSYRTVLCHEDENTSFFGSTAAAIETVTIESGVVIKNMSSFFRDCENLSAVTFGDVDTTGLVSMRNAFRNCRKLTALDLSKIPLSGNVDSSGMLEQCESLLTITLPSTRTALTLPDYYCPYDGAVSDESQSFTNLLDIPGSVLAVQKKRNRVGSDYIVRVPASVELSWQEGQFLGSFDITVEMDHLDNGDYVSLLVDDLDDPGAAGEICLTDGTMDLPIHLDSETTAGSEIKPHTFEKTGGSVTRHITLTSETGLSESACSGKRFSGGINVTYTSGRKWTLSP